ncbi:TRAP transporter substrate-binding protein DctP [Marinomonas sp. 15G1-11]|uniref:TRAP transporter substrate-binding protein DctP n=1 Tax=Marinomonas phaeophyticola TaxID=3004091 RepID=A0ABT4JRP5_9GAMM|nr:TRAP transporter substrate-binding protein DctP [Marinomonas sp. 15G1-11]MCZ2721062.1 TRAP transporter substrate-binding protein DctP [Marinomonas sp. 15G1-11]
MKILKTLAASAILSSALLSPLANAAEITWKVPSSVPEGSFFYNNFLKRFAGHVGDLTDKQIKVRAFGAGVIVPAFKVYESVQDGIVEAGHSTPSYLVNQDPTNAIFAGFPGGMSPEAMMAWLYEDGGLELMQDYRREKMGLHSLIIGIGTSEILAHANKPINKIEDFANLKYRTSGAWAGVLKDYLNGVPTVVPPGEIYTLLQRKGVDAVEWATPGSNLSEGFHEVAPYIIVPGIHQPTFVWEVVVKTETWDSLSKDLQTKVEAAARLTTMEAYLRFANADIKAMDKYRDFGTEIITLDKSVLSQIRGYGHQWMKARANEQTAKGDNSMNSILDEYFAYQKAWSRNSSVFVRDAD